MRRFSAAEQSQEIEGWISAVGTGALPRREFISRLAQLGIAAPLAATMLMNAGVAQAQSRSPLYKPTKRGGGGTLKMLYWQGPTLLNPHFALGRKDLEACRLFYEPLAIWDIDANLVPVLAAELPSRENGGIAADGRSVVWKLKPGITWHDGHPFGADDVVFTWQYASNPDTAALTASNFEGLRMEKVDAHTVRVVFNKPTPFWAGIYAWTHIVPKHLFERYTGRTSRDAPTNLKPVGTGPYRFAEFRPGDLLQGTLNPNYHLPNRPHFDRVEIKGGGDAVSAARAVLQSGEYDMAWNLLVEDELLKRLETGGKGRVTIVPGATTEIVFLNCTDPWTEVDGERASAKSRHPLFSDPAVRRALGLLVDRQGIQEFIYGRTATASANVLNAPSRVRSGNMKMEFNIAKANALLDAAGWVREGGSEVRSKGGKSLKLVFQSSINAPRQKTQAIIKQAAAKAGIAIEIKPVPGSVFFASDEGNPDTVSKFWADMQMYANGPTMPDAENWMAAFVSWRLATKANRWSGDNYQRWQNAAYDEAYRAAQVELDPVKRTALFIRMNDIVCSDGWVLPIAARAEVTGLGRDIVAPISGWGNTNDFIHDWYRDA